MNEHGNQEEESSSMLSGITVCVHITREYVYYGS